MNVQVSDQSRRARLARRHALAPHTRYDGIGRATTALTALHATEGTTVHLALHARIDGLTVPDVEHALYQDRSLVKHMGMRRTIFAVTPELLPAVAGSAGRRVAQAQRRQLIKELERAGIAVDDAWLGAAEDDVVAALAQQPLTAAEVRQALPALGGTVRSGSGKWAADVPVMSRLLTALWADARVLRGPNNGHWRITKPTWIAAASWLSAAPEVPESDAGYADLVRHWLWTFGPGTQDDLVWWLGSTKSAVRQALADVGAEQVDLVDGSLGYVLAGDVDDLISPPEEPPWVALLPTLDPSTMGWRHRDWYLDPTHVPYLFDSAGNGGTTVWADGRVIGCWVQDDDGRVQPLLREEVSRDTHRLLDREVGRLDEFLGGERITNVFTSPQMRGEQLR